MESKMMPRRDGAIVIDMALDAACRRLTRVCHDRTCPIKIQRCMNEIPRDCAARMKAYLLRRVR